MNIEIVPAEAEKLLSWQGLTEAFVAGHALPRAEIGDLFLYRGADTMLDRAAWIDGLGALVKVANVVPGNAARGLPTIHGAVNLFDDVTGDLRALTPEKAEQKIRRLGDAARILRGG